MISFIQLCEFLTSNQRYSWFLVPVNLAKEFTADELSSIYIEKISDESYIRFWYPKEKWDSRPMNKEEIMRMIMNAMSEDKWDKVKELKEKMNKL